MKLDAATRQKIQDEIDQWAEDMKFGRPTTMDAAGVAQALRLLRRANELGAAGDRVEIKAWDGGRDTVTVVGWKQVWCPVVISDPWTDEQRAHYAKLGYPLVEPEEFTIHPDDVTGKAG